MDRIQLKQLAERRDDLREQIAALSHYSDDDSVSEMIEKLAAESECTDREFDRLRAATAEI